MENQRRGQNNKNTRGLLNIIDRKSLLILENVTLTWTNVQEDLKHDPWLYGKVGNVKYTDMVARTTQGCTTRNTAGYNYMEVLLVSIGRAMVACIKMNWYNISMNNHSD